MDSINMEFLFPDSLSQDEVRERIRGRLGEAKEQFTDKINDLHENWNGNAGTFSFVLNRSRVSGKLTVKPSKMELFITNLPFRAYFCMGKIRDTIGEEVEKLLS